MSRTPRVMGKVLQMPWREQEGELVEERAVRWVLCHPETRWEVGFRLYWVEECRGLRDVGQVRAGWTRIGEEEREYWVTRALALLEAESAEARARAALKAMEARALEEAGREVDVRETARMLRRSRRRDMGRGPTGAEDDDTG